MSVFTQFTGGGTTPVGGVVMMPESTSVDQFTTNGQEFLRTGKLVTYGAAYANAVTNGQAYKQWGTTVRSNNIAAYPHRATSTDFGTVSTGTGTPYMTYALGEWGMMTPVSQLTGNAQLYTFHGELNGIRSPISLQLPPPTLQESNGTGSSTPPPPSFLDTRTSPTYMSGQKLWVFAEPVFSYSPINGNTSRSVAGFNIYSSKYGTKWKKVYVPLLTSGNYGLNIGPQAGSVRIHSACTANTIVISTQTYDGTNYVSYITQIGVSRGGSVATFLNYVSKSAGTSNSGIVPLTTVSDTEVLCVAYDVSSGYLYSSITDSCALSSAITSPDYINTGTNWCFTRNATTMVFFASLGNVVKVGTTLAGTLRSTGKSVTNKELNSTTSNAAAYAAWTGSYFAIYAESSTSSTRYQVYYSTDGNTWTSPSSSSLSTSFSISNHNSLLKNHYFAYDGTSTYNIFNFTTNSVVTPAPNGVFPSTTRSGIIDYVTFNSNLYAISSDAFVVKVDSNLNYPDMVAYNTATTGSTIRGNSRLKVVNGRLFVINVNNNYLFHSADGTTWTQVQISAVGRVIDVDYIGTNWVVVGTSSTNNAAYSSNLTSWTGVTVGSGTIYGVLNVGSALVAFTAGGTRRSTDGSTWTTPTGSFNVSTAAFSEYYDSSSSTAYVYVGGTPPTATTRYVSTDAGATWTSSSITNIPNILGSRSSVPFSFIRFNNINYCIIGFPNVGSPTTIPSASAIATTTDFTTFTQITTPIPMGNITSLCRLDSNILLAIGNQSSGTSLESLSANYGEDLTVVIDSVGSSSFVGTDQEITSDGTLGYLRIA